MRRTIRSIGVTVGAVIALFGLVGVVGVPFLLRHRHESGRVIDFNGALPPAARR